MVGVLALSAVDHEWGLVPIGSNQRP